MSAAGQTKAISGMVVAGLILAIMAPIPALWFINSSGLYDEPALRTASISSLSPPYANNTYTDVQVIADNRGSVVAEECSIKVYNANLLTDNPENAPASGESEQFDLPPGGGYATTVSIYLPGASDVSSEEGVKALAVGPFVFRTECSNAESPYV